MTQKVSNRTITVLKLLSNPSTLGFFNFMKYKRWDDFKVPCSAIQDVMSRPKPCRNLTVRQRSDYEKLKSATDLSEKDQQKLDHLLAKMAYYEDPVLSQSAIKFLVKRYAWEKYHRRTASTGKFRSPVAKGNQLEDEAIEMISRVDGIAYSKQEDFASNEYLIGHCDVLCVDHNKIIDIKTAWSINNFMPHHVNKLERKYWMQMQGYMELYGMDNAEVCQVLLNTPPHLIERERAKYTEKYVFGEIDREKYDEEMEKLDLAFGYGKIPERRRIITYHIKRCPEVIQKIYKRVERCRVWLNEFERIHVNNKKIITLTEQYVNGEPPEDNSEPDTADSREGD